MKTSYENPVMDVINFAAEDVITTSGSVADKVGGTDTGNWGPLN